MMDAVCPSVVVPPYHTIWWWYLILFNNQQCFGKPSLSTAGNDHEEKY